MTPDQVSGFFDAGESFIEGTIGAALVVLWLLARGAPPGPAVHGPDDRQVHACGWAPTCGGSSTSGCAT